MLPPPINRTYVFKYYQFGSGTLENCRPNNAFVHGKPRYLRVLHVIEVHGLIQSGAVRFRLACGSDILRLAAVAVRACVRLSAKETETP